MKAVQLGHSDLHLLLFSIIYFVLVLLISLKPEEDIVTATLQRA